MTPTVVRADTARLALAGRLAALGGALGALAGLVQATVGARIPTWTGAKEHPLPLGLLTIGLGVLAVAVGLTVRPAAGRRAAAAVGLLVPALLCFSTVGRLWLVPGVVLLAAFALVLAAGGIGELVVVARSRWFAVLVSVLAACQVLVAVTAAPLGTAALGVVGGLVLGACPWWRTRRGVLPLAAVGTVPFAVLTWTSLVTPLVAVLALALLAVDQRHGSTAAQRPGGSSSGPHPSATPVAAGVVR